MVQIGQITFILSKPFLNLTTRARALLITRLATSLLVVIFTIIILGGTLQKKGLYVNRLDFFHVDVADGLFDVLRNHVDSNTHSLSEDYGPGLTASEIDLLSSYTEEQVQNCPQYIKSNIYNWCFGNYNLTGEDSTPDKTANTEYCTGRDTNYVFDYRGELKTVGLDIILAYAYDDSSISSLSSDDDYVPDPTYLAKLDRRREWTKTTPRLLYFASVTQFCIMILALFMYGSRGYYKDDNRAPIAIRQILAILSTVTFFTVAIAISIMTTLSSDIRADVKSELGNFGISSHFGTAWFTLAWFEVVIALINASLWGIPIWCGTPNKTIDPNDSFDGDDDYIGTTMHPERYYADNYKKEAEVQKVNIFDDYGAEDSPIEEVYETNHYHDFFDDDNDINKNSKYITGEQLLDSPSASKDILQKDEGATIKKSYTNNTFSSDPLASADYRRKDSIIPRSGSGAGSNRKDNFISRSSTANGGSIFGSGSRHSKKSNSRYNSDHIKRDRALLRFNENDYITGDVFLTEDHKFVMHRDNSIFKSPQPQ
ncbi:hypothetical protein PACTADRAFT_18142 [Pachysolen tannophilus NRRL Y-2460]|uniref:Uncharacterized protein n=1 Tax=Pachysolen tannophilus NRRL Y-2460 TaxID=669874 RepID=A0A1E4TRS7_PACTA|nr:hypothetical protein PACTADRAFT_18142 [Pachysolen tannophilus NRRL Y-2460]